MKNPRKFRRVAATLDWIAARVPDDALAFMPWSHPAARSTLHLALESDRAPTPPGYWLRVLATPTTRFADPKGALTLRADFAARPNMLHRFARHGLPTRVTMATRRIVRRLPRELRTRDVTEAVAFAVEHSNPGRVAWCLQGVTTAAEVSEALIHITSPDLARMMRRAGKLPPARHGES